MSNLGSAWKHVLTGFVATLAMTVGLAGAGAASASAATDGSKVVAKSAAGKMTSKVVGRTADGDRVGGTFTPIRVVKRDGQVMVKGFLEGVITDDAGHKTRFSGIERIPVKKVNGQSVTDARTLNRAAACDILNLVLGPLDLNVLGLEIHLQRVVLDVVAVAGAGNLLGNLLCAVAGLLDGSPLGGLLTQLQTLLNQILGLLNLGV